MFALVITVAVAVLLVVLLVVLFKTLWRVAEPNQALVISGLRHRPESGAEGLGFKIVTGGGTFVWPLLQVVRTLDLDLKEADLKIDCVTSQGIPLHVEGTVIYKVGDSGPEIANAARRFLGQEDQLDNRVHNVFSGHRKAAIGLPH